MADLYPRTPTEIAANITPVDYSYPPGNLRRYGALGDGVTDDSAAVQDAAIGGDGVMIIPPGAYKVTTEITLEYVDLQVEGDALFVGTGSFRGVINNACIPHVLFQVKYNLVVSSERSRLTIVGDFFVDPLLGDDANAGTSAALALRTLSEAANKVAANAASAANLTIVLRSGRHETSGLVLNSSHTLASGGTVSWVANHGEQPIVSAPTTWFFKSSPITATYGAFTAVANSLGYAFWDLYDAETGVQIECASNMGPNFSLPRNQAAAVTLSGSSPYRVSITLTADDASSFAALTATEQAGVRLRISQSFTSSWHKNLSISGPVLTGDALTNSAIYYNGWNNRAVDAFGAPYLLQNLKSGLDGTNFCGFADNVFLPSGGTNYFTVDRSVSALISTGTAQRHSFVRITFRYVAAGISVLETFWTAGPFPSHGLLVGGTGRLAVTQCTFEYGNVNGIVMCQSNAGVHRNRFNMLGLGGVSWNNQYGSDGAVVKGNVVRRWGHIASMAGIGIYGGGSGITFEDNDVRCGPWAAMRADSVANIVSPSGPVSGVIRRNVLMHVGMIDGSPADYIATNDSGVLTLYGGGQATAYEVASNVIGPAFAYQSMRGVFGDDGINGCWVHDNLVWGQRGYAFDFREVGSGTFNNSIQTNLFFGAVNLQSATNTTDFSGNLVAATTGNSIDDAPAVTALTPNLFGVKASSTGEYVSVLETSPGISNGPGAAIAPFVLSFLRKSSFINSGPVYANSSITQQTTATYAVLDSDHDLIANHAGTLTYTLPGARTSAGRELHFKTVTANAVIASAAVVSPLNGGAMTTAILPAVDGAWARLKCDGANWYVMASG